MNRPRLQILADHLRSLPDEQFNMSDWGYVHDCGTVACIGGWASVLFGDGTTSPNGANNPYDLLGLTRGQGNELCIFVPGRLSETTRQDAISAIQSMLDSPDDDALPVWPSREGASA